MKKTKLFMAVLAAIALGAASARASEITFTKDVMPVLATHCLECHRSGQIAPMAFTSYEETRPWAESIKEAVSRGQMPPWHADPSHGTFKNERRLSEGEIATLVAWAEAGAPRGDLADLPPPSSFAEGWSIGAPDGVYAMTETYEVAAAGSDEYIYFRVPLDFEEERFVSAVEVMPGNRSVVHHVLVYVQPKSSGDVSRTDTARYNRAAGEELFYGDGDMIRVRAESPVYDDGCVLENGGSALSGDITGGRRAMLAAFAPGSRGDVWPEGTARRIPAGSEILLQIHYNKTGKVEKDRTSVGLVFTDAQPEKIVRGRWVQNYYFEIPPGATDHEVKGCYQFDQDVHLLSYFPHMHLRGKDMEMTAIFPSGEKQTLLRVPRYDFNWQHSYLLAEPIAIPKGTRILVTAHYDNSKRNPFNPDDSKTIRWGDPTYDEMMIGGMDYTIDGENLRSATTDQN